MLALVFFFVFLVYSQTTFQHLLSGIPSRLKGVLRRIPCGSLFTGGSSRRATPVAPQNRPRWTYSDCLTLSLWRTDDTHGARIPRRNHGEWAPGAMSRLLACNSGSSDSHAHLASREYAYRQRAGSGFATNVPAPLGSTAVYSHGQFNMIGGS